MNRIKSKLLPFLLLTAVISMSSYTIGKQKKILVFSKTAGYRHTLSIAAGKKYLMDLGQKNKFGVDTTENADAFSAEISNNMQQ